MAADLLKLAGDPDSSVTHEVARLGKKQLHRIVKLAAGDWTGTDSIHDMRVASRRFRELVKIQLQVEKSKPLKKIYRFGRELGHQLGVVRSSDVLIKGLEGLGTGDPIRVLRLAVSMRRREEVQRLESLLQSEAFEEWVKRAEREFDRPSKDGSLVKDAMGEILEKGREKVQSHREAQPGDEFSGLHRLRIDAKRLRYQLEFFSRVPGVQAEDAIQRLTDLQDHLGDLHDKILLLEEVAAAEDPMYGWRREEHAVLDGLRAELEEEIGTNRKESPAKWSFAFESGFLQSP